MILIINQPMKKNNLFIKTVLSATFFIVTFTYTGCSQNENKYFKETSKLVSLIMKADTVGIQSLIVCRLEDTKFLKLSLQHDIKKYNKLIAKFGTPTKYNLKQYPAGDIKLCDVIVKVGNDVDYGILTTSFYRNYEPDKIFLFDFKFDTNAKGLINSPPNQ